MIKIMHRLINQTGRYRGRIRAAYIPTFIKGIMMKVPMIQLHSRKLSRMMTTSNTLKFKN